MNVPPEIAGLPIIGPAIHEVGGGWVVRLSILSPQLTRLAAQGWRVIPCGAYRGKSAAIVQPPR